MLMLILNHFKMFINLMDVDIDKGPSHLFKNNTKIYETK